MPYGDQFSPPDSFFNPIHQYPNCGCVVGRSDWPGEVIGLADTFYHKRSLRQANPFNLAGQNPAQRGLSVEQRKFDARRAAINGQNAGFSLLHRALNVVVSFQ
jgi:hypothetical protein